MKRFLMDELIRWKNSKNRKPLLLKGARQTGKTWLMKAFGKEAFSSVAYINFDGNRRMQKVFSGDYDIHRILIAINAECKVKIKPENTLIILDEVQEAPRAVSALKYFCENAPEYPVIAAGSLLGVALHHGISFPVGKIENMTLHPLSYREFLCAVGENDLLKMIDQKDYAGIKLFRERYADWLKRYFYVGGMPEAVAAFVDDYDFAQVRHIQKNILELYEADFSKHIDGSELERVRMVWDALPVQLAKENKKFFFGHIKKGARASTYETAIRWIEDCGLLQKVYRVSKPAMPLKGYREENVFKIFHLDIGLLGAASELDASSVIDGNELFTEFKGALTEQYVAQQILAETEYTPFYYAPNEHTEIDFVVQKKNGIVPIEVKSAENLKSQSLKKYCEKHRTSYAVRVSLSDYREENWMVNLPLYAISNL